MRTEPTFSLLKNKKKEALALEKNYLQTYGKSSGEKINALTGVAQAYDAVRLLAHAIKNAKSFDSNKIKESLENLDAYEGAIQTYKKPFSKTDHDALNIEDFFMAKFDADGNIAPIKE